MDEGSFSKLHLLKQAPGRPSPAALIKLTHKLEQIEATGILKLDLSWLNNNFQRALARYVRRCSASRLRPERRYAALVCYLHQLYRDTTDDVVDTYDKLMNRLWNRAQKDLDAQAKRQRKQIRSSLANYRTLLKVLLDEAVEDTALRSLLFNRIERDELVADAAEMATLLDGTYSHVFHLVTQRHSYLRQFAPALLKHLRLEAEDSPSAALFEAVDLLRTMNKAGRRKLPKDAPMDFMPRGIHALVTAGAPAGAGVAPFWWTGVGLSHNPDSICLKVDLLTPLPSSSRSSNLRATDDQWPISPKSLSPLSRPSTPGSSKPTGTKASAPTVSLARSVRNSNACAKRIVDYNKSAIFLQRPRLGLLGRPT